MTFPGSPAATDPRPNLSTAGAVTGADQETAAQIVGPLGPQFLMQVVAEKIAAALAAERAAVVARYDALADELETLAPTAHTQVASVDQAVLGAVWRIRHLATDLR